MTRGPHDDVKAVPGRGRLAFGLSGWSYPDWKGVVYPAGCRDTLVYCAEQVDFLEVNSSFYAPTRPEVAASWVARTRALRTFFTAKLPQAFTHEDRDDAELVRAARAGFAPLAEAGRLRALLAQFSYRFVAGEPAFARLAWLQERFADLAPLVLEVRHRSWQERAALERVRALGYSLAQLDYPGARTGFGLWTTGVYGPKDIAYLRLHGRSPAWFQAGAGRDQVYDYEYPPHEVEEIRRRVQDLASAATLVLVAANNHFHGKAMKVIQNLISTLSNLDGRVTPS